MSRGRTSLTDLARLGFSDLRGAQRLLEQVEPTLHALFGRAADPDQALRELLRLREHGGGADALLADSDAAARLIRVLGASAGLAGFFERHPDELDVLSSRVQRLPDAESLHASLLAGVQGSAPEAAVDALRVRYRRELARIAAWDVEQEDPIAAVDSVAATLADLAGAALDVALDVARASVAGDKQELAATRLAVIGMGKAGARELNYLSDVDVIYVARASGDLTGDRAVELGTRLAKALTRILSGPSSEPALWDLDANLRPEGRDGALVRTLESHIAYYERWAKGWEFQALLKARPLAGDRELGARYCESVAPFVWSSASRENFVESVQGMRERVTANIPAAQRDVQLKLGPGGLRDIEFTIQLLQLVHGQTDPEVRQRATLPALKALAEHGYIGRAEAAEFADHYRFLRLLEHRLQLAGLSRTHLMPRDPEALRVLARASGVAANEPELTARWQRTKTQVRSLHERLFYRPLLSAVAALPDEDFALTSDQAVARLAAIGFVDPAGALRHIGALTAGISRRAIIQRNLLPVMLQWFADGADPDHGLLVFRRLSERLGESHWYLRMLRDSSGAAHRLTQVLASSRFVSDLFLTIPEAVAWLEVDADLAPRTLDQLIEEGEAIISRHGEDPDAAAAGVRTVRRREILRAAIASILGLLSVQELGRALTDVMTATIRSALRIARPEPDGIEFGVIAMGRYGGRELGFGSDADVLYVYRPAGAEPEAARVRAGELVRALGALTEDFSVPLELDAGLRPEGRNGPVVRSLDAYRAYYERWSLTWEAQALLRARGVAGDAELLRGFETVADEVRYPERLSEQDIREVKRIKARVEAERLPQGADPTRHLKLGRGSLSDVEWLVQLLQLTQAAEVPSLRITSTLGALEAAVEAGLLTAEDAGVLREAWLFASRTRSALMLWTSKTSDVLPVDRVQLEGVARLLRYPAGSASRLEDDYLRVTRRARQVFERTFYAASPAG
ncbi:bifunctional [glutamine synthetase] adenylyltransferase/[glutamine synthetase]-adenylyl-L-tyrosine phosphorylase [Cryobacterium sp. BB736]|uniref:bifunctional [glutamine synthetase] adenylyltransferase/[glutamine synthetase]-adenylyl-L-tyrosine phosphorylase n=1 Tax=Cryobacterium sp. BB736 TaxID=2746963 RepID=UPI0018759022|nr:bifunctional [glutamine synthetase] adenylyltransferase/[glutamine synthetase]-adenylyl-L-tyrosine phosphorylase [Cryobacterium sp. BB736]